MPWVAQIICTHAQTYTYIPTYIIYICTEIQRRKRARALLWWWRVNWIIMIAKTLNTTHHIAHCGTVRLSVMWSHENMVASSSSSSSHRHMAPHCESTLCGCCALLLLLCMCRFGCPQTQSVCTFAESIFYIVHAAWSVVCSIMATVARLYTPNIHKQWKVCM